MKSFILINIFLLVSTFTRAEIIIVANADELKSANKKAKPGDQIIMKNGDWNNITISLNCSGTESNPITLKAETPGKVFIKGNSKLRLGGKYIEVDGLFFTEGYAGDDAVIDFRINKNQLANNCRVTNTVIKSFNNPKRLDENYWVSFSGQSNRVDHCSFIDKNNLGVLIAVVLDDERSRDNYHFIDHNYFGRRLPLASNGGEIIRVGVSQHATFNSNTRIVDNFFEHCDGEGEIISIKSCSNLIKNNLFKECQGSVVLRHGDNNTVEDNIFLGNDKEGTGGVRIINRGQWVLNNLFYKCRGTDFRSPLAIMNGVYNSPANRYVQVTDAVIWGNSFVNCSPVSFGEGSDTERTEPPNRVIFGNNIFYNQKEKSIYNAYDKIDGIKFIGNRVSNSVTQPLARGFLKAVIPTRNIAGMALPYSNDKVVPDDSLKQAGVERLVGGMTSKPGFTLDNVLKDILANSKSCGANWMSKNMTTARLAAVQVNCKNAEEVLYQISKPTHSPLVLNLTADNYHFNTPIEIGSDITFTAASGKKIKLSTTDESLYFIQLKAGNKLTLKNLTLDLSEIRSDVFIITDTSKSSDHAKYFQEGCHITGWSGNIMRAVKSTILDTISIINSSFSNTSGLLFDFSNENDKKGYYNVEKLIIKNSSFNNLRGEILHMVRGGNDESTLGPSLLFEGNQLNNAGIGVGNVPLIWLNGTQHSIIRNNWIKNSNPEGILIQYEDAVRADHLLTNNTIQTSGKIVKNKFVRE